VGTIGIEILTRKPPFPHLTIREFGENLRGELERAAEYIPTYTPSGFKELLEKCLNMDPDQRPTFDQIAEKIEQFPPN
jgi:serine/threonine protein kinase